jgi:hypothetical protein
MHRSTRLIFDSHPRRADGNRAPGEPRRENRTAAASGGRPAKAPSPFAPPDGAIVPLFRARLERIHDCRVAFELDINTRPTLRVLGGYYKSRRLVRVYSYDRKEGRRPVEEVFDTFLHEVAHHLEYTEPSTFGSAGCRRTQGVMHSRLFWHILGELKWRWAELQERHRRQLY